MRLVKCKWRNVRSRMWPNDRGPLRTGVLELRYSRVIDGAVVPAWLRFTLGLLTCARGETLPCGQEPF
jgi:hypothetical protein